MSISPATVSSSIAASFQDLLNDPTVCSNCFRIVRDERELPGTELASGTTKCARESVSPLARDRRWTELDHTPGEDPTEDFVTWCECGVESAFHRERPERVGRDRLETFIQRLLELCEEKAITVNRQRLAERALELEQRTVAPNHRRYQERPVCAEDCRWCHPVATTDEILAEALEAGIQTAP